MNPNPLHTPVSTKGESFRDKEMKCQFYFNKLQKEHGPLWHICTPGTMTEIYNVTEDDYKFSVNNMAFSINESGLYVLVDAQMCNHLHLLAAGDRPKIQDCLDRYRRRLNKYLESIGRFADLSQLRCDDPIPITDLAMIRNEIVYIVRNGYVADSRYTPFSYPWGSGYLYFNPKARENCPSLPFNALPYREKRKMSFTRIQTLPESWVVWDGMIRPSSYSDIGTGESLFRDAHQYMSLLTKNVEAYSEQAKRLSDMVVLTQEEAFSVARTLSLRDFRINQPSALPEKAKQQIAKILHSEYRCTNNQIRTILRLDANSIAELFPKS